MYYDLRTRKSSNFFKKNYIKMTGTIKTLTEKGFGFIAREGEAKDLFFHSNDLSGVTFAELKVGDTVNFEIVDGQKGPSAKNVTRA
jgi:CspA family cold shock protein